MAPLQHFYSVVLSNQLIFYISEFAYNKGMDLAKAHQANGDIKPDADLSRIVLESQAGYLYHVPVEGNA